MTNYDHGSEYAFPYFIFGLVVIGVALWKLAERTKEEPKWFAFVPILNVVLLLRLARRPMWWIILCMIPIVNLVTFILIMMSLSARFGLNKWWGLVAPLTPFNFILLYYIAYGTGGGAESLPAPSPSVATPTPPTTPPATASRMDGVSRLMSVTTLKADEANADAMKEKPPKPVKPPPPPPPKPPVTPT